MRMITLFLPEKLLEMLDELVTEKYYSNRSEAIRTGIWGFLKDKIHEGANIANKIRSCDSTGLPMDKKEE